MKYLVSFFIIISLSIYVGCSNNLVSPPISNTSNSGQVTLKISGNNTPSNVKQLTAVLTRNGADTLISNSNPLTDTTGEINFTNVPAGVWHLTVLAADSMGTIIYRGETDITVESGVSINVSLTLIPVTNGGTGSISITVNWGTTQPVFVDYSFNPVFTIYQNPSTPNSVAEAKILYDNGIYKMWYLSIYNSGKANIWYAESTDGKNWSNVNNQPVFSNGDSGSWDDYTVNPGAIIKSDGLYRLYYTGWRSQNGKWQIGLATSADGINWERMPDPILNADNNNENKIGVQSVVYVNGKYYLYYTSSPIDNYFNMRINLAISSDGIHFTKYQYNPVLKPSLPWEGIGISFPAVIYDSGKFVMIYQTANNTKFGAAYSNDGINWGKLPNYIFSASDTKKWNEINYPNLIKTGNEYRLYYSGLSQDSQYSICFASSSRLF